MIKKHPILCIVGWFILCCLLFTSFTLLRVDVVQIFFIYYVWDKGFSAICKEYSRKEDIRGE